MILKINRYIRMHPPSSKADIVEDTNTRIMQRAAPTAFVVLVLMIAMMIEERDTSIVNSVALPFWWCMLLPLLAHMVIYRESGRETS